MKRASEEKVVGFGWWWVADDEAMAYWKWIFINNFSPELEVGLRWCMRVSLVWGEAFCFFLLQVLFVYAGWFVYIRIQEQKLIWTKSWGLLIFWEFMFVERKKTHGICHELRSSITPGGFWRFPQIFNSKQIKLKLQNFHPSTLSSSLTTNAHYRAL